MLEDKLKEANNLDDYSYNLGAGIPEDMLGIYLHEVQPKSKDQEEVKKLLTELQEKKFNTLLLIGDTGTGKTYMSQALANTMIHNASAPENAARYTTHFELDLKLKSTMNGNYTGLSEYELINRYKAYGLLIIDEFGRGSVSEYSMTKVEHILTERMMKGKRTIIISNKKPGELRQVFDRQMQDRLGIMEGGATKNGKAKFYFMSGQSLRGHL